jgi:hypothetical protein
MQQALRLVCWRGSNIPATPITNCGVFDPVPTENAIAIAWEQSLRRSCNRIPEASFGSGAHWLGCRPPFGAARAETRADSGGKKVELID